MRNGGSEFVLGGRLVVAGLGNVGPLFQNVSRYLIAYCPRGRRLQKVNLPTFSKRRSQINFPRVGRLQKLNIPQGNDAVT